MNKLKHFGSSDPWVQNSSFLIQEPESERGKKQIINGLWRLFLVQDMSFVIPLAERITILIEGK